ncbi:MAG: hypothetical protein KAT30_13160, partial [Candidatus Krumholzibacteria bacterium]|nr:hypothetical protein [Candidatus Krumholzibacteria bacterium]
DFGRKSRSKVRRTRVIVAFCCDLLLAVIVIGIGGPVSAETDAGKLIGRVTNTYGSLENYYFEGTFSMVTEVEGFAQQLEAPFVMAGRAPGKSRLEIDHEALGVFVVCAVS